MLYCTISLGVWFHSSQCECSAKSYPRPFTQTELKTSDSIIDYDQSLHLPFPRTVNQDG